MPTTVPDSCGGCRCWSKNWSSNPIETGHCMNDDSPKYDTDTESGDLCDEFIEEDGDRG